MAKKSKLKHIGDLRVTKANAAEFALLVEVTGDLYIRSDVKLEALTSAGGALYIWSGVKLEAPALTSVGGALDIRSDVKLEALTSAGGYKLPAPDVAAARVRDVAEAALLVPSALDMSDWHKCATTHCMAGWGIHLAGPEGYKLEKAVGPATAGAILLGLEAARMFHATTADARAWLKAKLAAG